MGDFMGGQQRTPPLQQRQNGFIRLVDMLSSKQRHAVAEKAMIINIIECANTVFIGHYEVFHAVIRRCMNTAGTGFCGDMVAQQYWHLTIIKGML